ncbi:FAD-dependent oxidoreductase [Occallatibacter riparius]|uniref:FAD-dependent oxidoreductase n=1 Tax=Occallatibacter riparius TaxID=1002689 RepID=A0A9J7BM24_9BACT|nr:FAD-dependent oxidoreductase [Occallatibacter riparius]UWZ81958.1 FAD-dependent oxidoreductase [Occallatibacter riparius]
MARPIILAVDDDVNVLEAVVQDLRRRYGADYRVMRAAGGQAALDTLSQVKERNENVALLISDQRMPGLTGVQVLERSREVYPEARRVLLTAYADTEAAIQAINSARIHYYLNKPWDPPEERLYPVVSDLLESWRLGYRPRFEGLTVLGHRWSARDHEIRSFLSCNHVPYRWLDVDGEEGSKLLQERKLESAEFPVVLFPDGASLAAPSPEELAQRVGLKIQASKDFYDLVVVGGGPAGLAAAVYGASEGLRTLVVEPEAPGGQAGTTSLIKNYLGFHQGITGAELGQRALLQAQAFDVEFVTQRAAGLRIDGQYNFICMSDGREVSSHAVVLAPGVQYRKLDVPGAERLTGRGIYYGAALVEAPSCKDEDVYVVGGANSAGQAALHFSKYARTVTMLVRGPGLAATMSKYLIDEIGRTSNIVLRPQTQVIRAIGEEHLEGLRLRGPNGEEEVKAESLFVFIGAAPRTDWLPPAILRDEKGFILAGPDLRNDGKLPPEWQETREPFLLETSVPGVFVAGDVRHGSVKRVASAVGEGSIAVQFIHQYLAGF